MPVHRRQPLLRSSRGTSYPTHSISKTGRTRSALVEQFLARLAARREKKNRRREAMLAKISDKIKYLEEQRTKILLQSSLEFNGFDGFDGFDGVEDFGDYASPGSSLDPVMLPAIGLEISRLRQMEDDLLDEDSDLEDMEDLLLLELCTRLGAQAKDSYDSCRSNLEEQFEDRDETDHELDQEEEGKRNQEEEEYDGEEDEYDGEEEDSDDEVH